MLMSGRYAAIQRFQEQERQIRQQRGTQQQSPQTVGATIGVHMPMPVNTDIEYYYLSINYKFNLN
jgi:hypothetical protein